MQAIIDIEQRDKLRDMICDIEQQSSAEIVTVISRQADDYWFVSLSWAGILSFIAPIATALWYGSEANIWQVLTLQLFVYLVLLLLLRWPPIEDVFVPRAMMQRRAKRMAHELFFMQKLNYKDERKVLMLFVAQRERYVELIADKAINDKVASNHWVSIVNQFVERVKAGQTYQGFEESIAMCGAILIREFPALEKKSNNVYPDHLIVID